MRRGLWAAGAILASLLVLLATMLLIRGGILQSRERSAYRFALQDAVYALEQGRNIDAAEHLRRAADSAYSPEAWLRLLKRARRLKSRELYEELLTRGHRAYPESEPLSAARGLRLLEEGKAADAWKLLSRRVDPDAYPALLSAALLASGAEPGTPATEELALFAELPESDTSAPFLRAYAFTQALPFLDNALLIALRDGDFEDAQEILDRFPAPRQAESVTAVAEKDSSEGGTAMDERRSRLLLMAAHTLEDRGAFYTYLRILGGRSGTQPEPLLLQADLRMSARELAEAARLYEEVRSVVPAFSPVPYVNGAWLRRREGLSSVELLEDGRRLFPGVQGVETALLQELIYQGLEREAEALIAVEAPSLMTRLLDIAFFRLPDLDRGYTPRLWQLLNEEENAPAVGRLLAYHLVGLNDLAELHRLLDRFPEAEHPWSRFYLGYLALRRGDYPRADELFSRRPGEGGYPVPRWIWEGNAALTALYTGSVRRALEGSRRARELLIAEGVGGNPQSHGTLLTLQAEALRLSGERSEAVQVARRAVELAPESNSARLVLRNLERPR